MKKVTEHTDEEGFTVITTVEVLPKVEKMNLNGVSIVKRTYKDGSTTMESSCTCMGMSMHTHSRDDCHNRLRILANRRGNK